MPKVKVLKIITVLTVLVIWGHSLMPGDTSSSESGFIMSILLPIWNGIGLGRIISLSDHIVRKVFGHFAEYTLLGMELKGLTPFIIKPFVTGWMVAFIDESIQLISADRGPAIADVWLDMAGVATGMIVVKLCQMIISYFKDKKRAGVH